MQFIGCSPLLYRVTRVECGSRTTSFWAK